MSQAQFSCPSCGRKFPWKAESAGRKGKCKCGNVLIVPAAADPEPEPSSLQVAAEAPTACPGCGQTMEPGAVLCLHCGYNLRTGGKMATQVLGGAAPAAAKQPIYPQSRRRGQDESAPTSSTKLYIILGAALLVVAMGVGGWIIFRGTGGGKANVPRLGDDAKVEELIKEQTATDLGEWIQANPARGLHHRTPGQAIALEKQLKGMGAKRVLAFGGGVLTTAVAIELPQDPAQRKELFDWFDRNRGPGDPPVKDVGQNYLLYYPSPK